MSNVRRGNGRVYKQPNSANWWIKFYVHGQEFRQSSGTPNKREAIALLDRRRAEVTMGQFSIASQKVTISSLLTACLEHARLTGLRSYKDISGRVRLHLEPALGSLLAADLTTHHLNKHIESRLKAGARPATINREMEVLKRAFNLGAQHDPPKVLRVPHFTKLKEDNVRTGFFELQDYEKLLPHCIAEGPWMRGIFETGYTFGWRAEEIVQLPASQVDMSNRCIRLNPGETKNDEGRIAYMTPELYEALVPLMKGKRGDDRIFTREDGTPVNDIRKAWWRACVAAGLGSLHCRVCNVPSDSASSCKVCKSDNIGYDGLLLHDLRRTAVRNMVRRNVPEKWAMAISGH